MAKETTGKFGGKREETHFKTRTDIGLIHNLASKMGVPPEDALYFINLVCESIIDILKEQTFVNIRSFGIFKLQPTKRGKYRKSFDGKLINVPLRYAVRFLASGKLKSKTNERIQENLDDLRNGDNEEDKK